jgi:hypothetical protein
MRKQHDSEHNTFLRPSCDQQPGNQMQPNWTSVAALGILPGMSLAILGDAAYVIREANYQSRFGCSLGGRFSTALRCSSVLANCAIGTLVGGVILERALSPGSHSRMVQQTRARDRNDSMQR